ncbi:MAG: CoA transferase [Firmicutes bacterium]|nr:CoA transferase [Bacillota bacterium]
MAQVLSDVRVLDLTDSIAGPFAGKLFADFGADVIKVEPPQGDPARRYGPFPGDRPHPEASALFLHLNRNKRGITLNLAEPAGRELFLQLAKSVDIVLESFAPGQMDAWGIGFEKLRMAKPSIVVGSLTPYGQYGPYATYRANDICYYAIGGPMNATGAADLTPIKKTLNMVEAQAGNTFASQVMAAFMVGRYQGEGQHVDVAAVESQLGSVDRRIIFLLTYQFNGETSSRSAGLGVSTLPMGIYPCADGYVQIMTTPAWAGRMLATLQDESLNAYFKEHPMAAMDPSTAEVVQEVLYPWLLSHTKQECFEEADLKNGWPVFPLSTIEDVMNDPHFEARQYFLEIEHPVAGKLRYPGAPWRMAEGGFEVRRAAPLLGEHNEEIYCEELGLSSEELARLRALGIV